MVEWWFAFLVIVLIETVKFLAFGWLLFGILYDVKHRFWKDYTWKDVVESRRRHFPSKDRLIPPKKIFLIIALILGVLFALKTAVIAERNPEAAGFEEKVFLRLLGVQP